MKSATGILYVIVILNLILWFFLLILLFPLHSCLQMCGVRRYLVTLPRHCVTGIPFQNAGPSLYLLRSLYPLQEIFQRCYKSQIAVTVTKSSAKASKNVHIK